MLWFVAMLLIMPLLLMADDPVRRFRVWFALIGASLASWALGGHDVPIVGMMAIDFIAAMMVLSRPAGEIQRQIGLGFAMMLAIHIGVAMAAIPWGGFSLNAHIEPVRWWYLANVWIGWGQWVLLAAWGLDDAGKYVRGHRRDLRAGHGLARFEGRSR